MFKVGDKVVCVDDIPSDYTDKTLYSEWVMENKIYTVREFIIDPNYPDLPGVLLEEIKGYVEPIIDLEYGFLVDRFRKLEPPMEVEESIEEQKVLQEVN